MAIRGAIVPGPGPNSKTEVDTTVFGNTKIRSNGLGHTTGSGQNKVSMLKQAMALSGNVLPQVSMTNGTISGVYHIVTTDGAGPIKAILDPTGTGSFKNGTMLKTLTQVPGKGGNIKATKAKNKDGKNKRFDLGGVWERATESVGLVKRAGNVNLDFPMKFAVPDGVTCTGTINGIKNVCLVKIANSNKAGPFGGVVAIQMAAAPAPPAKRAVEFKA